MSALLGRKTPDLAARLEALRAAAALAEGRLPPTVVEPVRAVVERAGDRLELGLESTVVALAGATGSGKSSLFNALAGSQLSEVGVRRPTTGRAHACVWGDDPADALLDWLGVPRRHRSDDSELDGLVLLDLPDHDSTEVDHRIEVDRLLERVDLFVWVVDPQKYADAALHEGYLRRLATHAGVTLVVLNQVDRLTEDELRSCAADLRRLLAADGLGSIEVLEASARTGRGLSDLRAAIAARVAARRAALQRLGADVDAAAQALAPYCEGGEARGPDKAATRALVDALARAAGVDVVTDAVARSYRRDAALRTGWPFTRWLRKLRPDPLGRLHLGRDTTGGRTSLRPATALQRAEAENAIRSLTSGVTAGLPDPWPDVVRGAVDASGRELLAHLDRAVSNTELAPARTPAWWSAAGALQALLAAAAVVGFLWLTVLFALQWLQIPRPPMVEVGDVPLPTALLGGGLLLGFLLAALFGRFARVGAGRRRRSADKRLRDAVAAVAEDDVLAPLRAELAGRRELCSAVRALG